MAKSFVICGMIYHRRTRWCIRFGLYEDFHIVHRCGRDLSRPYGNHSLLTTSAGLTLATFQILQAMQPKTMKAVVQKMPA